MDDRWNKLLWHDEKHFSIEEIHFHLVSWGSPKKKTTINNFVLVKDPLFSQSMARICAPLTPKHILEFGVYHGASLVLLDKVFAPSSIVGIDERQEHPVLSQYRKGASAHAEITPYCGIKQDDVEKLNQILELHFPKKDVDLIIDDCSHLYEPTKTAFVTSFPYLKSGGIYIIEDWGWAHWLGVFQETTPFPGIPLSKLIFELLMLQSVIPNVIAKIETDYNHVAITKGEQGNETNLFDLIRCKASIEINKQ
ncbi:class I SAM-dependent methyltransferase [Vibrio sp. ZSDE26]|uniref:Class I SAM-dependent methyltransferase n=1 Tax=Vibrio amylolyticus TaxID=2847292 RepID=A0A9X1XL85_9VIBR|nr:class I SAM-dependent methyltransferase [Vibrio amylolyticus]MCK6263958.1 class I SAM-dependent methyltransferase [Vibrio amylolyticus]